MPEALESQGTGGKTGRKLLGFTMLVCVMQEHVGVSRSAATGRPRPLRSVSYTHLDVYKRQVEDIVDQLGEAFSFAHDNVEIFNDLGLGLLNLAVIVRDKGKEPFFEAAANDLGKAQHRGERGTPVSYTHLDVYKRQTLSRSPRSRR